MVTENYTDEFLIKIWQNKFKDITIKSLSIPFSEEFYSYLTKSTFNLPHNAANELEEFEDTTDNQNECVNFSDTFFNCIKEKIIELGGNVFPKINLKAPIDAKWINFDHNLRCTTLEDILLLMKASDIISRTLKYPSFKNDLVLKKWIDINPAYEFRIFIKDKAPIAISQRETSHLYDYIKDECIKICDDILKFYAAHIQNKFDKPFYSFDIYRECPSNILLLDFNCILNNASTSLLFNYEELMGVNLKKIVGSYNHKYQGTEVPFRYIEESSGIQPLKSNSMAYPFEICHFNQFVNL